jgi:hypothetical protein
MVQTDDDKPQPECVLTVTPTPLTATGYPEAKWTYDWLDRSANDWVQDVTDAVVLEESVDSGNATMVPYEDYRRQREIRCPFRAAFRGGGE